MTMNGLADLLPLSPESQSSTLEDNLSMHTSNILCLIDDFERNKILDGKEI